MKRSLFSAALVAISGLAFSAVGRADDLQAMAGRWVVEAAEAGGNAIETEELKSLVVTIEGGPVCADLDR